MPLFGEPTFDNFFQPSTGQNTRMSQDWILYLQDKLAALDTMLASITDEKIAAHVQRSRDVIETVLRDEKSALRQS